MGMKVPLKFTRKSKGNMPVFMYLVHFEKEKTFQTISCQGAFFPRGSGPDSFGFLQSGLKNNDIIIEMVINLGDGCVRNIII